MKLGRHHNHRYCNSGVLLSKQHFCQHDGYRIVVGGHFRDIDYIVIMLLNSIRDYGGDLVFLTCYAILMFAIQ
jgi:hypothetical protein